MNEQLKNQKLLSLCLLFFILFNFPILSLVNKSTLIFGIPMLYLYLYAIWLCFIVLVALLVSKDNFNDKIEDEND
jgi:hypothetical protein